MEDVVIVDAARSPVGRKNGSLGGAHPTDVLGQVMTGLLARNDIDSSTVDQVAVSYTHLTLPTNVAV